MNLYQANKTQLGGTSYAEVMKNAHKTYNEVKRLTRRQSYVRSAYFNRDKVFINIFWNHLAQKRAADQVRRARLLPAAIELLRHTQIAPETIIENKYANDILFRFSGITNDGVKFYVQVRQNKKTGRKDFMSVFPANSSVN